MNKIYNNTSPIPNIEDFIWVSQYANGEVIPEYFNTNQGYMRKSITELDKNKVSEFGVIGLGYNIYYDLSTGIFDILGRKIELRYVDDTNNVYSFMNKCRYDDIIMYRCAESAFDASGEGVLSDNIIEYSFGYKFKDLNINGKKFSIKFLTHIPINDQVNITFWVVCNNNINGRFEIVSDNIVVSNVAASLKANFGGEIKYIIK